VSAAVAEERSAAAPARIGGDSYLLGVALFLLIAATNILTPLLPDIRNDFGVSIATAGIIVGSYGLARLIIDLPAGFVVDRIGHLRVSIFALILLAASSILGLNAGSVEVLILARVGAGVAAAILGTVILSGLGATATRTNRGKVMSFFHVANNTGIAIYPMIGGLVGLAFGWRATFAVTAALVVLAAVILIPVLIAIAAINLGVLANMINRHGFRNTILPLYAATVLGLGGVSIATAIALMSITGLTVATPGGMLGDRIGRRRIITTGLAAIAVGDLVFLFTHDLWTFLGAAALIGFGDFFSSSQTSLLSEIVPAERRTQVLGGYRFSADVGAFVGPVLLAAVMDLANAQAAILVSVAILLAASAVARFAVPVQGGSAT
jgi:MFS family permease